HTALVKTEVRAIIEDLLTGNLFVGGTNKIFLFDSEKRSLTEYYRNVGLKYDLGEINSFHQSNNGSIWTGHMKGLSMFEPLKNSIKHYQPIFSNTYIPENAFANLIEDDNGLIWGSTISGGLVSFNPQNELFQIYKHDPNQSNSISSNTVWSFYKDQTGIIWVGTGWAGLNKWDRNKHKFKRFSLDLNNPDGERFNRVNSVIEDSEGIIWFGTANGLNSFNRFTNEFRNYKFATKDNSNRVNHIYIDESGIIWFGTTTKGLGKFNTVNGSFHFYSNDANNSGSISHNQVRSILPGENDILWIGTWGGGLNRFDKKTGRFTSYKHDSNNPQSLSHNQVLSIYEDRKGILWLGTNGGSLNRFNKTDESFESFDIEGSINTTINAIYEDHKENFWVGTYHSGIHLFDRNKGISIYNITERNGLINNQTKSILEDDSGNLWISTVNGLSRFDSETQSIKNYFTSDGFEANRYWKSSACKTSTGEMLFGTYDGFIMFHPDSIKDDPVPPKVVISNVSLFNRPGEKLTFDGFISDLNEVELAYNENDLRFDYVGLHLAEPEKNQYKYMLENYDKNWVDAGTQRNATYTNLDAGDYVFRVKACNRDGVWNEEGASLRIIIPPPFWATWWAYILYIMFIVSLFTGVTRFYLNRQRLKKQLELEHEHTEKLEEIDKMKSRFFANISHEFRTPLTLILGPSENIITEAPSENATKQAGAIKRNANRLLVLINQLLDLSKLEVGKLELKASKSNIVSFIKGITMSFESVAEGKDITLKVKSSNDEIEIYFDKEKMTKILTNLLSNAFKYTGEGGEITVAVTPTHAEFISASSLSGEIPKQSASGGRNDNMISICIKDSGIGISKEELPKLFDRFYQVDSSQTREHEGTGIGLALTKELVELHHGTISVDSKLGDPDKVGTGWTEFTVDLPLGNKHLKDDEIVKTEEPTKDDLIIDVKEFVLSAVVEGIDTEVISEDKNILLVVEDNADVREYIKDSLGEEFQIEEASNGEQGVRKAENIIPDLIISDIMMPKMDGNELTRILKNDERTSHIPIILLTAKSEQESKLEGLEAGADDYLTKPFDTKELQIRISNLINLRRGLQKKFSKGEYKPKPGEKKLSKLDQKFINRVIEVI
ncbi:MAG: hypothetical protein DRQ01_06825, partial [Ignavibacteriae bacterium]